VKLVGNSGYKQSITFLPQGDGSVEDGACNRPRTADNLVLDATEFIDALTGNEVAAAFAMQIDEGTCRVGGSTMLEGVTSEKSGDPSPCRS
jgi:hypothetical protein